LKVRDKEQLTVDCRSVWKIYGVRAKEALHGVVNEGLSKKEVQLRFGCVIGVADVSFCVKESEIFCIMGLSGSGKSTLIRLINRLIEPTAGQVIVCNEEISKLNKEHLRRLRATKIGMVFQNIALLPHRTVRENVALGLEFRGQSKKERFQAADKWIDMVKLSGWENCYPDELSGGMQQRVGLARALATDPEVLLMDEPFSALDPLIRRQLQKQFLELSAATRKTTLFITHDLDEAIRLGDRIAIMKEGKLVQIGTPEQIVTRPADDYVADFVAGLSRLKLVYAHTVMEPLESYGKSHAGESLDDCPTTTAQTDLDHLIDIIVCSDRPVVVVDGGAAVGVVTKQALLRGIQGKQAK
jgi:glycine betaine/proline transport system ATP-binding protein